MASDIASANTAIYSRIEAAELVRPELIYWPNTLFTPPAVAAGVKWLKVDIVWGDGVPVTMGETGRNTLVGVIYLSVYTPKGEARGAATQLCDQLRDLFNRVEFAGVRCNAPSAPAFAPEDEWERAQVRVGFTFDETLA